jgi:putative phosphoesterase
MEKRSMSALEVAVLSDIHGNRWALEAVLEDIERKGIRDIVNLGDCLYGPLDPAGTADILIGRSILSVRGNEDRASLDCLRQVLCPVHRQWLDALEMTAIAHDELFLCHGTPGRDDEYLLREVREEVVFLREAGDLMNRCSSIDKPVLLCGHDHLPLTVQLPDGKLIVNPGSVGLPAYTDTYPYAHAIKTGSPHARYGILRKDEAGWRAENIAVCYDWKKAASVAMANGRPDWSLWLHTGRARDERVGV